MCLGTGLGPGGKMLHGEKHTKIRLTSHRAVLMATSHVIVNRKLSVLIAELKLRDSDKLQVISLSPRIQPSSGGIKGSLVQRGRQA